MQREVKNKQPGTGPAWEAAQRGGMAGQAGREQPRGGPKGVNVLPLRPPTHALPTVTALNRDVANMGPKNTPLPLMRVQPELPIFLSFSGSPGRRISILGIPSVQLLPLYNTKVQPVVSSGSGCSFKFQEGKRLASADQWLLPSRHPAGPFSEVEVGVVQAEVLDNGRPPFSYNIALQPLC